MAISAESKEIYFWAPAPNTPLIHTYKYMNAAWKNTTLPEAALVYQPTENDTIPGEARAVFDVAHHHLDVLCGSFSMRKMMSYQPADNTSMPLNSPLVTGNSANPLQITLGYAAAWSTLKSVIMTYGGTTSDKQIYNTNVLEYVRVTTEKAYDEVWTVPKGKVPSGITPGEIAYHCMVPAYKGTKMVVFGGRTRDNVVRGSIFFLDVLEMKWSKGPDADPSQHRSDMACAVAGDNFVIWG
ncbi:hypothetical protein BGZ75_000174, partial [Mortierella antarctica]